MRYMVDAIGGDSPRLPASLPTVAGYVTGSPGIIWTIQDWARFHGVTVPIDQSTGEQVFPQHKTLVLDVERGAKTIAVACTQARLRAAQGLDSTIYVAASNFLLAQRQVTQLKLTEHVWWWVANWSLTENEAAALIRGRVIGVQYASAAYPPTADTMIPGTKLTLGKVNADLSVISEAWSPLPTPAPAPVKKTSRKPHPKVAGSSAGALLGVGITAVLKAAHVTITPEEAGAVSTIAAAIAGTITPTKSKTS